MFNKGANKGYGTRYDKMGGNYIQKIKDQQERKFSGMKFDTNYQKRFCETCQQLKPKGERKAVKGWKCDDCLKK